MGKIASFIGSPFVGAVGAIGAALWQARTTGGIEQWFGLPFAVFVLSIGQSLWVLVRENLAMKEAIRPKLEIVFLQPNYAKSPDDEENLRPFLQTIEYGQLRSGTTMVKKTDRRYRIGVINHSKAIVRKVRAELIDFSPGGMYVFPNHPLLVHATEPGIGETDVYPSVDGEPSVFFDVVNELGEHDVVPDNFRICYANPSISGPVNQGNYVVKIRVMGEHCPPVTRLFRVIKEPAVINGAISFEDFRRLRMEAL